MRAFLVVAIAVTAGGPAYAAPEPGSRIDRAPLAVDRADDGDDASAVRVMNQFARCYAQQRKKVAQQALAMPLASAEQIAFVAKTVPGVQDCMGFSGLELTFKAPAMMGGMAEQLLIDSYPKAEVSGLAQISDEKLAELGLAPRNGSEDFALCLARKDPVAVRALVDTEPASEKEAALIKRLVPHLGSCVVQGTTLTLNKQTIRTLSAVGLYRILSHNSGNAGSASPASY